MKVFTGKVIAIKSAKTATVAVERLVINKMYKKRIKSVKKYQVHDEIGTKVGDRVKFITCAPISKMKMWKITEVTK